MPNRTLVSTDFGQVTDATLSRTGLTILPRYFTVTTVGTARPTWAGPVVWIVRYTPASRPTNAKEGDHVIYAV